MKDVLEKTRDAARTNALRDFAYFSERVLGRTFNDDFYAEVAEDRIDVSALTKERELALLAWFAAKGQRAPLEKAPTETFKWIFAERVQ